MTSDPSRLESASLDSTLTAVGNEHRRAVLRSLARTDGRSLDRDALTDRVAEQVTGAGPTSSDDHQRIAIKLHHVHLPKLAEWGMVAYDPEVGRVRETLDDPEKDLIALLDLHPATAAGDSL